MTHFVNHHLLLVSMLRCSLAKYAYASLLRPSLTSYFHSKVRTMCLSFKLPLGSKAFGVLLPSLLRESTSPHQRQAFASRAFMLCL